MGIPNYLLQFTKQLCARFGISVQKSANRVIQASIGQLLVKSLEKRTELIRVGNPSGDGGYFLPQNWDCDLVISIGVGSDWSFDSQIAANGVTVVQLDGSIEKPNNSKLIQNLNEFELGKLNFIKKHIGIRSSPETLGFYELAQFVRSNFDSAGLKMDIEGFEWRLLASLHKDDLQQFSWIVVEIHDLDRLQTRAGSELFQAICDHLEDFEIANVELNQSSAPLNLHGTKGIRQEMEFTFVRKPKISISRTKM